MFRKTTLSIALACSALVPVQSVMAQNPTTTRIAAGFSRPVFVTAPPGDTSRLFVVEQRGSAGTASRADIRIIDLTTNPPTILPTPFLSITGVSTGSEQGLLGLAFHPDYATNRAFFVYLTNPSTQIRRYLTSESNPNVADASSVATILTFAQPESNHNGGWIGFGPDGNLYIATGDGGGAGDVHGAFGNAQNLSSLLGKMLRIAVSDTGTYTVPPTNPFPGATAPFNTIWSYGLRNPWRSSFDRDTGAMWIGDVGQNAIEEISYQPPDVNGSMAGRNYGWRCFEGNNNFNSGNCGPANQGTMIFPVHTFGHTLGRCSVTGGYVYRGSAIPSLQGHYLFADYCGNQIYSFQYTGSNNPPVTDRTAQLAPGGGLSIATISSFGEDAAGEMYITDLGGGEIFKVIPSAPANNDCANATLVGGASSTNFATAGATTTGPEEGGCGLNGQIGADVWYKFQATCTGTATASVCGANFDTRLAAYGPCPTAAGEALACNDNFCGTGSEISFPVVANTIYRVRVGGTNNATGSGTLVITCTVPPPACPADITADSVVNVNDLLAVINNWGPCPGCAADINNDDVVNVNDLLDVINGWGKCPL